MIRLKAGCVFICCSLAGTACNSADAERAAARRVHVVEGLSFPESVRYDPEQDVYFVSCIQGFGSVKDGRGYIVRIDARDPAQAQMFVQSGVKGVVLDAPKGMALQGDTLWVADIDVLRGFDRRTGAAVGAVDFTGHNVMMLNDVALGPDGAIYVSDTGIIMSPVGVAYAGGSKIFRVSNRQVSVLASNALLAHPNGLTWDSASGHWLVVTFHPDVSELYALTPDSIHPKRVLAQGLGRWDGVEVMRDGRILVTSWSDSSVHVIRDGESERIIRDIWQPADLGVDTRRNRIAIPLVLQGRVEIWRLAEEQ